VLRVLKIVSYSLATKFRNFNETFETRANVRPTRELSESIRNRITLTVALRHHGLISNTVMVSRFNLFSGLLNVNYTEERALKIK
jgi:hypothetical protein